MKVVHIDEGSDKIKKLGPSPAEFDKVQKKYYQKMGKILIKAERLKAIYLPALKILAVNMAMYEFAVIRINDKNKKEVGSGYIQEFKNGTSNISPEISLKKEAENRIMQCLKQFGMDPKSDKELGENNTGQLSLFQEAMKALKAN